MTLQLSSHSLILSRLFKCFSHSPSEANSNLFCTYFLCVYKNVSQCLAQSSTLLFNILLLTCTVTIETFERKIMWNEIDTPKKVSLLCSFSLWTMPWGWIPNWWSICVCMCLSEVIKNDLLFYIYFNCKKITKKLLNEIIFVFLLQ